MHLIENYRGSKDLNDHEYYEIEDVWGNQLAGKERLQKNRHTT
jgi:hypothetical protein